MKPILVFDTETTGLPLFSQPSGDPAQPHIVQLAAAMVHPITRKTIASIDLIAKPDGWEIPAEVSEIHGITTEHAQAVGVDQELIVSAFMRMWQQCGMRVAHNVSFDARIIRIALKRFGYGDAVADEWKAGEQVCTMRLATPICNLPPTARMVAARRNGPKSPTLGEAIFHFFGEDLQDAHTALADVNACTRLYWALRDRERVGEAVAA